MRDYISALPQRGLLCHRATLSLFGLAMTGTPRMAPTARALDFAVRLGYILPESKKILPPVKNLIPPELYSVFAIKDKWCTVFEDGWVSLSHTVFLFEATPRPLIVESGIFSGGVSIVPLHEFIAKQHAIDAEVYQFSPEVIKRHFF